jgi:hypothetical protein
MKTLTLGHRGQWVIKWQYFLLGQDCNPGIVDSVFGLKTREATITFQNIHHLVADGIVGRSTFLKAFDLGLDFISTNKTESKNSMSIPIPPKFKTLSKISQKYKLFERFEYAIMRNDDIKIKGDWKRRNIRTIEIPQLKYIEGAPSNCKISFHKKAAPKLKLLFEKWETAGLLHLIKSWDGSFMPRLVRGSDSNISSHTFGIAFDINSKWNRIGTIPAPEDQEGSVRKLVPIANKLGFYWGGHVKLRKEGMHFEIAKL